MDHWRDFQQNWNPHRGVINGKAGKAADVYLNFQIHTLTLSQPEGAKMDQKMP